MINLVTKSSGRGQKLEEFIKHKRVQIEKNCRILYVIQTNAEPGVVKVGIAGNQGNAYNRLRHYQRAHGINDKNACTGVKIFFCGRTSYNKNVHYTKTQVYKVEQKLKVRFAGARMKEEGRGDERFKTQMSDDGYDEVSLNVILQFLKEVAKGVGDEPTEEYTATRSATLKGKKKPKKPINKAFGKGDKVNVTYPNLKNQTYRGKIISVSKDSVRVEFENKNGKKEYTDVDKSRFKYVEKQYQSK